MKESIDYFQDQIKEVKRVVAAATAFDHLEEIFPAEALLEASRAKTKVINFLSNMLIAFIEILIGQLQREEAGVQ